MPSCPEKRLKEGGKVRLGEKKELLKSAHTRLSIEQNPTNVVVGVGVGGVTTKLKE